MTHATVGRNVNFTSEVDHKIILINSVTATTLVVEKSNRVTFSACLEPGDFDVDVFIRYYRADVDDLMNGRDVLVRETFGNSNLFHPIHEMLADNIYDGEISAITSSGEVNLLITES